MNEERLSFFKANGNAPMSPHAHDVVQLRVEHAADKLLEALLIDTTHDPNSKGTARRIAKMFVREVFAGRFTEAPDLTCFPNHAEVDELVATGPITVRSMCSHHFCPIVGKAWIGYVPGEKLLGLSKFNRVVEWFASRGQIQEELGQQISDFLQHKLQPKGIAVVIQAQHSCMTWRGVQEHPEALMTTSNMLGVFRTNAAARAEFLSLVRS